MFVVAPVQEPKIEELTAEDASADNAPSGRVVESAPAHPEEEKKTVELSAGKREPSRAAEPSTVSTEPDAEKTTSVHDSS